MRFHAPHTVLGIVMGAISYVVAPALVLWMSPVLLGLILSAPIGWFVSRASPGSLAAVLSTPEDRDRPSILRSAEAATASWRRRSAVLSLGPANDASPAMAQQAA